VTRLVESAEVLRAVGVDAGTGPGAWEVWARRVLSFADAKPRWVSGEISWDDAMFLYSIVRATGARDGVRRVVEIGVASGVSSAIILAALRDAGATLFDEPPEGFGAVLRSYDIGDRCYFDHERAVGEAALEMTPDLLEGWALRTGCDSIDASEELDLGTADVAFIDADHRHPWPAIDALALLGVMRPGSWIVLHDVRLEALAARHEARTGERVDWKHKGARVVFEAWPLEKVVAGSELGNIGAVRVGRDREETDAVRRSLVELIGAEVWERGVMTSARHALERLGVGAEAA
jgi:predicted O-methyltransferase YrrM